jgi:ABC-2 type transport system ATP-binding protein
MQLIDILSQQGIEVAAQSDQGLLEVGGVTAEQIGELAAVQNIVLHELTPIEASLEEAFMDTTRASVEFGAEVESDRLEKDGVPA